MSATQISGKDNEREDLIIENDQFKLVVGHDAIAKSLIIKSTNEECLMQGREHSYILCHSRKALP